MSNRRGRFHRFPPPATPAGAGDNDPNTPSIHSNSNGNRNANGIGIGIGIPYFTNGAHVVHNTHDISANGSQAPNNHAPDAYYNQQWADYYGAWAQYSQYMHQAGYRPDFHAGQLPSFDNPDAFAMRMYPPAQQMFQTSPPGAIFTQPQSFSPPMPALTRTAYNLQDAGWARGTGRASVDALKPEHGAVVKPSPNDRKQKGKDPKIMLPAPQPTREYLAQAAATPFVVVPPVRKLVILDLNGTLIHRPNARKQPTRMECRPFLEQFLSYLLENFLVMVWSSARPETIKVVLETVGQMFSSDFRSKLVATWGRDTLGLTERQYDLNVQCFKDLNRVWSDEGLQSQMPGFDHGKRFDQRNTILIDDSALKASAQPYNLLEIPEFKGLMTIKDMKQDVLGEVAGYLEILKMQEDVSKFIRQTPFKATGTWSYDWQNDVQKDAKAADEILQPVVLK